MYIFMIRGAYITEEIVERPPLTLHIEMNTLFRAKPLPVIVICQTWDENNVVEINGRLFEFRALKVD